MKTFTCASLLALLVATPVLATPMVAFAWRELSLTTDGGARLQGRADGFGNILFLSVAKGDNACVVDEATLARITGAGLNNVAVFEDATHAALLISIKAADFDARSGNALNDIRWSLWCKDGRISSVGKDVHELPAPGAHTR